MKSKSVSPRKIPAASTLMIRLDPQSKEDLKQAALLRHLSLSDYVRQVTLAQARREVRAAQQQTIVLTSDEQHAFWQALHASTVLTPEQRSLSSIIRGEA